MARVPTGYELEQSIADRDRRISELEAENELLRQSVGDAVASINGQADEEQKELEAEVERLRAEVGSLLRCTKGHIHNQEYGNPCPLCEVAALREDRERLIFYVEACVTGDAIKEEEALSLIAPILNAARAKERGGV